MPEDDVFEVTLQGFELAAVVVGNVGGRNARDFGDDLFDLSLADDLFAFARRQNALRGTGLVDNVNRLVGQMPVIDVFGAELGRCL